MNWLFQLTDLLFFAHTTLFKFFVISRLQIGFDAFFEVSLLNKADKKMTVGGSILVDEIFRGWNF